MTIHPRIHFGRREFLRSAGIAIALPPLMSLNKKSSASGMHTSLASTDTGAPLRMAFMSIPNGVQQDNWFPTSDFKLNESMAPLQELKDSFQVISGLDHINATAGPDGAGDHARANATFLTGARARKTAGSDIQVGISVDQLAAQKVGYKTRFPSLELTSDMIRNSGSCDSGYACAYQYNLAWSSPSTPVTPEANPRQVFERLFGAGAPEERKQNFQKRIETERSVLDFVLDEAKDLDRRLGISDRRKLDEYLEVVREMENRIQNAERIKEFPIVDRDVPSGIPPDFAAYMNIMYDMLTLAFRTDSTRIATLLLAYDGSNRIFPELGIPEGHHYLTHNQRVPELAKKVARIDQYYLQCFAGFLSKLKSIEDVDGNSILHNSMIVYGGAIADGNKHTHENLPVILAGNGGGRFKTGRFNQAEKQPMSNLYVHMLQTMGIDVNHFGDSTGTFSDV